MRLPEYRRPGLLSVVLVLPRPPTSQSVPRGGQSTPLTGNGRGKDLKYGGGLAELLPGAFPSLLVGPASDKDRRVSTPGPVYTTPGLKFKTDGPVP
jgi:hypothetical protein